MTAASPLATPKRKRGQFADDDIPTLNTARFSFDLDSPPSPEDGSSSPRTKVAHRFRGLVIDGGGGGVTEQPPRRPEARREETTHNVEEADEEAEQGARKRVKLPDVQMTDAQDAAVQQVTGGSPQVGHVAAQPAELDAASSKDLAKKAEPSTSENTQAARATAHFLPEPEVPETKALLSQTGSLERSYPSINRLSESSSRIKNRPGTPPPPGFSNPEIPIEQPAPDLNEVTGKIIEPVRASLTWHEDEITIYDPDDSDDDGTGINGIGFKPTPAIAHARMIKRRQQLAEYRKREEREARARRSQRRRGSPVPGLVELKEKVERRRVRFMESAAGAVGAA